VTRTRRRCNLLVCVLVHGVHSSSFLLRDDNILRPVLTLTGVQITHYMHGFLNLILLFIYFIDRGQVLTDYNIFPVDFFIGLIPGDRHHSCKHGISLICRDEPNSDLFCHTYGDNRQIAYYFLTLIVLCLAQNNVH